MEQNQLNKNVDILKSRVTKTATQGVLIAIGSIIFATLLVCYYNTGEISLSGIIEAQSNNFALWVLNVIPFVFAFWGQYSSSIIAYEAGAMIHDQTQELRAKADNLEKQANHAVTHDLLTDLPNRALFYDRVERSITSANERQDILSVLLVEIENYKEIYDTLGRNSSDIFLKQIATRLSGIIFGQNSVARIDGNVFALHLSGIKSVEEPEQIAQQIHKMLEPVFVVESLQLSAHSNIGIVMFPEHGEDVDALVQRAGVALYIAGQSNQGYAVYKPSYDEHSPRRLTIMSELRQAIERGELELYYQVKISLARNKLYGVEALIRWNHPTHGFIPPDEFIPMAERTRMIKPLSKWALKQAFQHCAEWHKAGLDLMVSVNLSAKDLHDPELPDLIAGIVGSTDIQPEWIILEITESSIMTDPERVLEIVERLDRMGFQFAIDDFGTGYSSLAYLKKMPITELKIDRSFVTDMLESENDAVIVNATINLAHNLGMQVTAEGVENKQIMEYLKKSGCDIAQGYYINRPLSFSDINDWIKNFLQNPRQFLNEDKVKKAHIERNEITPLSLEET